MHALDVCNRMTVCFFMLDSSVATFTRSLKLPGVTLPPFGRSTCRCCGARRRDGFNFVSPHASRRVACIVFKEDGCQGPRALPNTRGLCEGFVILYTALCQCTLATMTFPCIDTMYICIPHISVPSSVPLQGSARLSYDVSTSLSGFLTFYSNF